MIHGTVHSLFIGKLDFRLCRVNIYINGRRIDMEIQEGERIARFGQHGVVRIFYRLEYDGIMDNAVIDNTYLPGAAAL